MAEQSKSSEYERGLELAEAGEYEQALERIAEHLRTFGDDTEALNDAGAILHCLGRSDDAVEYLERARTLNSDGPEIAWNLAEAYLGSRKPEKAMSLFTKMDSSNTLNIDLLNRTASIFLDQGNKADSIELLLMSRRMSPEQEILKPMLEVIRSKRPKIAFFCGGDGMTFLDDIVEFTKERFDVRIFQGQTEDELYELTNWSDISWFEWCTDLAVIASKHPKICKNIVRLHRYEAYGPWPTQINWENIDLLVTVGNKLTQQTLIEKVPNLENQTKMISVPNGVNLEKFTFTDRKRGKNIAFLANLRMVKNPAMMLQCMQKLHYFDPEYRLFFGGAFQEQVLEQYLRHMVEVLGLTDVVFFDGYQEDAKSWLEDKHYIVSTSVCEGHPVGILEAMACGLKPVIHNFPGAGQFFSPELLFNISEEFCERILSDKYEPQNYREFVEENYSQKKQLKQINEIFTEFEREIDSQSQPVGRITELTPGLASVR
jgi:hypothetical protein